MLRIQVLGSGMIPRGYGLAPRLDPFPADFTLIGTILSTHGLSIKYVDPTDGKLHDLTRKNAKKVYDKFNGVQYKNNYNTVVNNIAPHIPEPKEVDKVPEHVSYTTTEVIQSDDNTNPFELPKDPEESVVSEDVVVSDNDKNDVVEDVKETKNNDIITPITNESVQKELNQKNNNQNNKYQNNKHK